MLITEVTSEQVFENLAKFPKKKLLGKKIGFLESRRQNLEIWLNSAINTIPTLSSIVQFLEIPDSFKSYIYQRTAETHCRLSNLDLCVANFIRRLDQSDHKKLNALEKFDRDFFNTKQDISLATAMILLTRLVPLCGLVGVASKALDILCKLSSSTTFRYYQIVIDSLVRMSLDVLRDMKLNLHLTRAFQGDSPELAYHVCLIIKEQLLIKGDSHLLNYILNDDKEAIQALES